MVGWSLSLYMRMYLLVWLTLTVCHRQPNVRQ